MEGVGVEGIGVGEVGGVGVGRVGVGKAIVLASNCPRIKSSSHQIVMYPRAFGANEHFGQIWDVLGLMGM